MELRSSAIVSSIVYIHNTVIQLNEKLKKATKKFNFLTPRDFLDFIKHFIELHSSKKEQLEEQQFHLNVGLQKLEETEDTVINLKQSLSVKKVELETKEKESTEKLNLMMKEKFEATEKKKNSELLQEKIKV